MLAWFSKNPTFLAFPLSDFPSTVHSPALLHTFMLSHVDSVNPCTAACHAPLSMGFSLQKYWSRLPCPSPGDTPDLGIEPMFLVFPALQAYPLPSEPPGKFPQPCSSAINLHCPLLHLVGIEPTSLLRPIFPLLQWFLSKISFTALTTVQFWFYCEMGERL